MRAGRILRQLVMDRIKAEVPGLTGVYDRALESTAHPYATLGPSDWTDDSVECIRARTITLQIDLWDEDGSKGRIEDLTDDVAAALDGWDETERLTMHPARVVLVRVMDDPSGGTHGVVQIEIMVEG